MTGNDLDKLKKWFLAYCRSFYMENADDQKNIHLKEEHSYRVCGNMRAIATGLKLQEDEQLLAETVALFHDVGRFPQYAKYRTFRDDISVNHGLVGVQVLEEERVLEGLSSGEKETVMKAIRFHNAFSVPRGTWDELLFIRLVRDADKLDIWRVFLEYHESPAEERASAAGLGLPGIQVCSREVIETVKAGKIVSLTSIRTLDDFKVLQLSWVFDLNFRPSFELLMRNGYIERMLSYLPPTDDIREIASLVINHAEKKLQGSGICG
jgi:HD superfamily phosphohydrolase YqeK